MILTQSANHGHQELQYEYTGQCVNAEDLLLLLQQQISEKHKACHYYIV